MTSGGTTRLAKGCGWFLDVLLKGNKQARVDASGLVDHGAADEKLDVAAS